jgi:integrase
MAANWPRQYVNICENLRLARHQTGETLYRADRGNPALSIKEVLDFLDMLARHSTWKRLLPAAALQGLCGLRIEETLRLKWKNVRFDSQTVTIEGKVKNLFSIRRIPIPTLVICILWDAYQSAKNDAGEARVVSYYSQYRHYSQAMRKALRIWDCDNRLKPKDLRNTILTEAYDGGWHGIYLERYVGHAPRTISERNYHGNQGDRLLPLYQTKVVVPIERLISDWEGPMDSPILLRYTDSETPRVETSSSTK